MAEPKHMYELMYILNGILSEEQIKDRITRVKNFIEENGGELIETEEIGSQRLAYPIRKKRNGYYVLVHMNAPGSLPPKLDRALVINEDILRFIILRFDAKMKRHYDKHRQTREVEAPPEVEEKVEAKAEEKVETKVEEKAEAKVEEKVAAEVAAATAELTNGGEEE